jgi:hypothetical protein
MSDLRDLINKGFKRVEGEREKEAERLAGLQKNEVNFDQYCRNTLSERLEEWVVTAREELGVEFEIDSMQETENGPYRFLGVGTTASRPANWSEDGFTSYFCVLLRNSSEFEIKQSIGTHEGTPQRSPFPISAKFIADRFDAWVIEFSTYVARNRK